MRSWIGKLWLRTFGWKLGTPKPEHSKFVIIGAPHTSGWDLPFTLATAWALGIDIRWIGKHTLFEGPFGWFMHTLGGIPVDRRASSNMVTQLVEAFAREGRLVVAVSPEGTRGKAPYWRSGFYHIAHEAGVPIGCGYVDYARKESGVGGFITPTGDVRADMDLVRAFYRDIRGKYPENQTEPRLREEMEGVTEAPAARVPPFTEPVGAR